VPLLVYGLALPARAAVAVSLATVGLTALVGAVERLRAREIEVRVGLIFALAGAAGAPVGQWIGALLPERLLLVLFALLMAIVALRMWRSASRRPDDARVVRARIEPAPPRGAGPACRRDPSGRLTLTSRCFAEMIIAGLATGMLSGAFGVGGGFLIVPALVFMTQMSIHHAVATSLLVITLVSGAGVASALASGAALHLAVGVPFAAGGVTGMLLGTRIGRRLSGPTLQRVFAAAIIGLALFMMVKNAV
jgi:uncharacterized membrane protein YfcA